MKLTIRHEGGAITPYNKAPKIRRWGGIERIPKRQFYALGGFACSDLFRKHNGRCWEYYRDHRR